MSSYVELLKNPKWQKRRLEVLKQAEFTCAECGAKDRELHIHHYYYIRGKAPWEYSDAVLKVLCKDCHEIAEIDRLNLLDMYFDLDHKAREEVDSVVAWYCGAMDPYEAAHSDEYKAAVSNLRAALDRWFKAQKDYDES